MKRILALRLAVILLAGGAAAGNASAQSNANELAGVEQAAMESYTNLDLDTARDLLESGIDSARDAGVSGAALAKACVSLGIVYCGGYGDTDRCKDLFVQGLQEDGSVELDPAYNTPDIAAVFDQARSEVFGSAPRASAGGAVEGNLVHTPAPEQLEQTGVPVYVEVPSDIAVQAVRIFYRSLGMREPASADMGRMGDGWGYIIPCTDVYQPTVEYFVVAIDADGQQVGNAGTPRSPVVVPIVQSRTMAAPSLPGQPPPSQCGQDSCSPGMPGCGPTAATTTSGGVGSGGLGDMCRSQAECGTGLVCDDNFCAVDRGQQDEDEKRSRGDAPRFFVRVGGGIGLALVKDGMSTATTPSEGFFYPITNNISNPPTQGDIDQLSQRAAAAGYNCDFSQGTVADCKAILFKNGLFSTTAIRFEAGYFVTEHLSLSIVGRFQPGAQSGFMAGLRAGYLLGEPKEKGFQTSIYGGFTAGQIQPQLDLPSVAVPGPDGNPVVENAPFIKSGIVGLHAGLHLGYRFVRNFGIYASPEIDLLFPNFLFNIDLTGGLEVAF